MKLTKLAVVVLLGVILVSNSCTCSNNGPKCSEDTIKQMALEVWRYYDSEFYDESPNKILVRYYGVCEKGRPCIHDSPEHHWTAWVYDKYGCCYVYRVAEPRDCKVTSVGNTSGYDTRTYVAPIDMECPCPPSWGPD